MKLTRQLQLGLLGLAGTLLGACGQRGENDKETGEIRVFRPSLIYGADDRRDYYQVAPDLQKLADSTVALVKSADLGSPSAGRYRIPGESFQSAQGVCASEPFATQPVAAFCSGSLIAPDLILTAGHCVRTAVDCAGTRFVFAYAVKAAGALPTSVAESEVYACKTIIHSQVENAGADFAIIRLDRGVAGRVPLPVRKSGVVAAGDRLLVIGHPVGLPTKIAGGAKVRSVSPGHFVASLDTYGGNSGSAVFNASTGAIEGVLVRGDTDFVRSGNCYVSNRCADDGCRGEDVTRMDKVLERAPLAELPGAGEVPPPVTEERFAADVNAAIPDNDLTGIRSGLSVGTAPRGRTVRVTVNLVHTYRGDLVISLVSPDGREVVLHNRQGAGADNVIGTFGGDLASTAPLAALSSVSAAGTWQLKVSDRAKVDVGKLVRWGLIFK